MPGDIHLLYGGSFNPIHVGHLIVARSVAEQLGAERVTLIPSAAPPHKRDHDLLDAETRLELTRLAVAGDPGFDVSDIEVRRQGPSYTFLTLQEYRDRIGPEADLCWIVGADTLPELHTWYRIRELLRLCRIVTAARPGFESPDLSGLEAVLEAGQVDRLREGLLATPRIGISATVIRERAREGASLRYLVPEAVRVFIERRRLFAKP